MCIRDSLKASKSRVIRPIKLLANVSTHFLIFPRRFWQASISSNVQIKKIIRAITNRLSGHDSVSSKPFSTTGPIGSELFRARPLADNIHPLSYTHLRAHETPEHL